MKRSIAFVRVCRCVIALPLLLLAGLSQSQVQNLNVQTTGLEQTFQDMDEVKATPWENWRLKKEDWERYEFIVANTPWSVWQNTATPYLILAVYADTLEEKRRFARLEAELDQWRERVAFRYQNIYNDEREIVFAKVNAAMKTQSPVVENITPGNKVALFTDKGECYARCVAVVNRILDTGARVDVYVMNATTEQEVFAWADSADIPVDRVMAKQITLNYETGEFAELSTLPPSLVELPVAYFDQGGTYVRVAL